VHTSASTLAPLLLFYIIIWPLGLYVSHGMLPLNFHYGYWTYKLDVNIRFIDLKMEVLKLEQDRTHGLCS
jgi:hypothetical protein